MSRYTVEQKRILADGVANRVPRDVLAGELKISLNSLRVWACKQGVTLAPAKERKDSRGRPVSAGAAVSADEVLASWPKMVADGPIERPAPVSIPAIEVKPSRKQLPTAAEVLAAAAKQKRERPTIESPWKGPLTIMNGLQLPEITYLQLKQRAALSGDNAEGLASRLLERIGACGIYESVLSAKR